MEEMREIGDVRVSRQGQQELLHIATRHAKRAERMVYGEPLFSLSQFNAQYVRKLSRYFQQVLGDFGPHQTKCISPFSIPYPSWITIGFTPPGAVLTRSSEQWKMDIAGSFSCGAFDGVG
jgi:hypothetical protein